MKDLDYNIINLSNFLYKVDNLPLFELCYNCFQHPNLDTLYDKYKNEYYSNIAIAKMEEKKRKQIFNLSLYIADNLFDLLTTKNYETLLADAQLKIKSLKLNWKDLVIKYYKTENCKKYILKDFRKAHPKRNAVSDEEEQQYIKKTMTIVNKWVKDDTQLLSSFYYVDDLQYSQKKTALINDSISIICSAEDFRLSTVDNETAVAVVPNDNTGKFPSIILENAGIFGYSPLKVPTTTDFENGKDAVLTYGNLKITIPIQETNMYINKTFNAKVDAIPRGKFELSTLASILDIGDQQLITANKIHFTFPQIISLMNLEYSGATYHRIEDALFYMALALYTIKIERNGETITRMFHLINAIDKPTYNARSEKEWTIELDNFLRDQIVIEKNVLDLQPSTLYGFRFGLTSILYGYLKVQKNRLLEENNADLTIDIHLNDISQILSLEGRPARRKKMMLASLDELSGNYDILKSYNFTDTNNMFHFKLEE